MSKKTCILPLFILLLSAICNAQEKAMPSDSLVDTKYREDQFYIAVTFNLLVNQPEGMNQNGFSGGFHAGFIRDMPINKRRNLAIGLGAGFSMNTFNENLFIGEEQDGSSIYKIIDNTITYDKNWLSTYLVEAPIQLRWRSSTATSYNFWRVYAGLQLGYVYAYKANFQEPGNKVVQTDIPELDKFRMGTTFSFGYETFNIYFYYSINSIFKDAQIGLTGENVDLNTFKLGLIFYLL